MYVLTVGDEGRCTGPWLIMSIRILTAGVFLSSELISRDESSRLLDDISDMFFIAPCLANLSDI